MRAVILVALCLLGNAIPSDSQSAEEVADCLTDQSYELDDFSLPGESSYTTSLGESLIQDPESTPLLYVRPRSGTQLREAVLCAKELDILFCVRSGGHSWGASSTCPGLNIDLKKMTSFKMDGDDILIEAGGTIGETLYELYTTQGKIIPIGTCPGVGVGGYIQGGGIGLLSGSLGLLADNVVHIEVVTPEGDLVQATATKNTDLFWALRGGGGGYLGAVTKYTIKVYDAEPYDENVYFSYRWGSSNGAEALHQWTKYAVDADPDLYLRMTARFNANGIEIRGIGVCWRVSSVEACEDKLERTALWAVADRHTVLIEKSTDGVLEALKFFTFDGNYGSSVPSGPDTTEEVFQRRFYSRSYLADRSWSSNMWEDNSMTSSVQYFEELLELMVSERMRADIGSISLGFYPLGNATQSKDDDFSAFPHRNAAGAVAVFYSGGSRSDRATVKDAIQTYLKPFRAGAYINYLDLDLANYADEYWGSSLSRMRDLKSKYDPNERMWHPQPL